jgi:hypothetical protein
MTQHDLARGDLTAYLLGKLNAGLICGDGEPGDNVGWTGPPNKTGSSYIGYCVLTPLPADQQAGPIGDSSADWILPYRIDSHAISREQAEYQADKARALIRPIVRENVTLGLDSYQVQQVRTLSIGGIGRTDNTDPSEFSQSDVVAIYVSKELY